MTAGFLPVFTLLLCYTLPKSSILCCNLKPTPPPHMQRSIVGSCCHLRPGPGLARVLLTPNSGVDPTQPAGCKREEGKICLRKRVGGVCRDEWMDGAADRSCNSCIWRSCQCESDHGYYYSLHGEMAKSADAIGSNSGCEKASVMVLRGLLGRVSRLSSSSVTIYSILVWTFGFWIFFFYWCKRGEPFVSCE